jgi:hypothetical protein
LDVHHLARGSGRAGHLGGKELMTASKEENPARRLVRYRQRPDGTLFADDSGSWVDLDDISIHHLAMLLIDRTIDLNLDAVKIVIRMERKKGERRGAKLEYEWSQKLRERELARRAAVEKEGER